MTTTEQLLARRWCRIDADTPRDRPITVFMPAAVTTRRGGGKEKHRAHITRAIWFEDHRDERSARRHDLMMKHDGYWAQARSGNKPLPYHPTHWMPELPFPHDYVEEEGQ